MMRLFTMRMSVLVRMMMLMFMCEVHVELGARNRAAFLSGNVHVEFVQSELLQFMFKLLCVYAEIQQRADEHVAADAAERVEKKRFHFADSAASALIWLAA
jgi:hypothetical protein